jgi:hypothetical protein
MGLTDIEEGTSEAQHESHSFDDNIVRESLTARQILHLCNIYHMVTMTIAHLIQLLPTKRNRQKIRRRRTVAKHLMPQYINTFLAIPSYIPLQHA